MLLDNIYLNENGSFYSHVGKWKCIFLLFSLPTNHRINYRRIAMKKKLALTSGSFKIVILTYARSIKCKVAFNPSLLILDGLSIDWKLTHLLIFYLSPRPQYGNNLQTFPPLKGGSLWATKFTWTWDKPQISLSILWSQVRFALWKAKCFLSSSVYPLHCSLLTLHLKESLQTLSHAVLPERATTVLFHIKLNYSLIFGR